MCHICAYRICAKLTRYFICVLFVSHAYFDRRVLQFNRNDYRRTEAISTLLKLQETIFYGIQSSSGKIFTYNIGTFQNLYPSVCLKTHLARRSKHSSRMVNNTYRYLRHAVMKVHYHLYFLT